MNITKHIGLCGILLAGLASPAPAAITSFQQGVNGYSGATSTYTEYQPEADQNKTWGGRDLALLYADPNVAVATKVMFMRFDLSSIASGVDVNSASLSLYVEGNGARGDGYLVNYTIYPILREGLNFGTANGAVEEGALSFNYSSYSSETPVGWGTGNAVTWGPVAGQDYGTTAIGNFVLTDANASAAYVNVGLDTATVANWINNPASNLGFVIVPQGVEGANQAVIYTGNAATAGIRPTLTVESLAVPEPGTLALGGLGAVLGVVAMMRRRRAAGGRFSAA